ncbi:MAG: hypothetical protein V4701_09405 [Pseudomonadota bacterium]
MLDENGLYDPRPFDDDEDLPPSDATGGYRVRSDDTWGMAREAYLAGETAADICARFDVGLSAFWAHARQGGWRRRDQPDREPLPVDAGDDIDFDADYAELAEHALRQLRRAMARGRGGAAASWMRLHDRLLARAKEQAQAERKAVADAEAKARAARNARLDAASAAALSIEGLAHRIVASDPRDTAGRAAIDAELARLDATLKGTLGRKPNTPNEPNTFSDDPPARGEGSIKPATPSCASRPARPAPC